METTETKKFNERNVIKKLVENTRLKTTLGLHVINQNVTTDLVKKTVTGQVLSYKSDNLLDSISDSGAPQPANGMNFTMSVDDFSDLENKVVDYVISNIEKIASV